VLAALGQTPAAVLTPLLTLIAFLFAVLHASQRMGWKSALLLLALTFGVSLLFESVGVATGLVYGPYHYTARLGDKFLGLVPLLIPLAWFMMMYPSYVIAARLVPATWKIAQWRLGVAALGGIAMTAWDLAMDPLMVSGGYWVWDVKGAYFGVPLQNYWGWLLTTFVTFMLFLWLAGAEPAAPDRYDLHAIASYTATGLTSILYDLNNGLGGPGLVGLFAMLPWVVGSAAQLSEPAPKNSSSLNVS
jgi:putative membrane protein